MRLCVACSAAAVMALVGSGQELEFVPGPEMGITTIPASNNLWKALRIAPVDFTRKAVRPCPEADFFTLEYGAPLEPFTLDVMPEGASRLWGERYDDHSGQAVRFQRGWAKYPESWVQVRAEIEQAGEGEVCWTLLLHDRRGQSALKTFKTRAGANAVAENLACFIRIDKLYVDGGIELVAKGEKGIRATVKSLQIVPVQVPVSFRRTFTLKVAPWRAGLSISASPGTRVYVNGALAATIGVPTPWRVARFDLTDKLVTGENEIVIMRDGNSGWERNGAIAAEVFSVERDGRTQLFPTDASWEAKSGDGPWQCPRRVGTCGLAKLASGLEVSHGCPPLHAGVLDPKPVGSPWPVFDAEGAVAYNVALPPDLPPSRVTVTASDAFTGETIETAEAANGCVAFRTRRGGAYRLAWTLLDAEGRTVDTLRSEMLIIDKLDLDEFTAEGVETELKNRLTLVDEIDCTAEPPEGSFLDHSGYYSQHVTGVGRVIERDGFKVRETGPGWLDLLSWRFTPGKMGVPHVCEVDFPDTREQYLYASVSETFPIGFCNNNPPSGSRSWPSASGAAASGGLMPLSGGMKTLRFVFVPSSSNITFNVENGVYGKPVGLCRVRIYEVKGMLPALKIPETERVFANYCERPVFFNWGNAACPYMLEYDKGYREGMWAGAYLAIVNRIQQLRFTGQNAAVEAGFMYDRGFRTTSGYSMDVDTHFDPNVPLLMMYKKNGIRTFLAYEYMGSPNLMDSAIRDTSDREVAQGKSTISFVDRYGRQTLTGFTGSSASFLAPEVRGAIKGVLQEMYARYAPLGVEGIFHQVGGCAWLPTFTGVTYFQDEDEVGYDDRTVGLFERDLSITLDVDSRDPHRFNQRYEKIHADATLLAKWRNWRQTKIAECHRDLAEVVKDKWRYIVAPCVSGRDPRKDGYDFVNYPKNGPIELQAKASYDKELAVDTYAKMTSDETLAVFKDFDNIAIGATGLNEHNFNKVDGAKKWWWRTYGVIVYDMLPSGDNALYDCASLCQIHTPKTFLHTWIDMNLPTGHDAAYRRFLEGFYATPVGEGVPYAEAVGVTAHVYGGKLQLLNLTPYPLVSDEGLVLKPFDLKVVGVPRPYTFRFADEARAAVAQVEADLAAPEVVARLPEAEKARLASARTSYDRLALSRRGPVLDVLLKYGQAKAAFANQARLERALASEGVARINCGNGEDWTDETGVAWLPDQMDTGFRAYGCRGGKWTSRGSIAIAKTDRPGLYRTESSQWGRKPMSYVIPVPNGTYRVILHMADTFNKEDRGAKWTFGIGSDTRTLNIWQVAGGTPATATTHVFEKVCPMDGVITVDCPLALLNGIEIHRQ